MPRDWLPSGSWSSSGKALTASLAPARQTPTLPARNRNCRRVTIARPPLGLAPRPTLAPCSRVGAALSIVLPLALLGDRPVVLLRDVAVAGHEALARISVHLQALGLRQVAPRIAVQIGGQVRRRFGLVVLGGAQPAAVLAVLTRLEGLGL